MTTAKESAELLLRASRELLILVDPHSLGIIDVNPYACELLGYRREAMLGRPITDFEAALQDVFYWAEGSGGNFAELNNADGLYACANGDFLPVEKSVVWAGEGDCACISICARDARANVTATSKLLEASAVLQATFESTAEGILVLGRGGRIANYNRRCTEIWGVSEEGTGDRAQISLLRRIARLALKPGQAIKRWRVLVQRDGEEYNDTFELKDGRSIRCRSRPLMMQEQIEGRVVSFADITERILRERELAAARDAAAASAKAKSDFLAMMSHEIRTPLTGILGMTELVLDTELAPAQREYLEMSNHSARGLLTIINDVLDFSRIEAGKMQIESLNFDLVSSLSLATKPLAWQAKQRGLVLDLDVSETPELWVIGDPTRIQQIIINLLGNAIKFTESGSVTVSLRRKVAAEGRLAVEISVRDTGIGISPEKLAQIFEAFTQAEASTNRRFGGTGLGLSISNRLAHLMGGKIDVESCPGSGSEFRVCLTMAPGQAQAVPQAQAAVFKDAGRRMLILIAEDTRVNQVFLSSVLKKAGHDTLICNNGEEAVAAALSGENAFDLILMDIQMPVMDGFAATQRLREAGMQTPIVALTAHASEGFRNECMNRGMNDYLAKPINTKALLDMILGYADL